MNTYERNLSKEYIVMDLIGKGSFGEVSEAMHRVTRKTIALKKIANAGTNLVSHLREVKMMKRCTGGKNIVAIYGSEIVGNDLWIGMELCEAGSVFDIMRMMQSKFSEAQIAYICKSTLAALNWMSENNISHRDIKPHNLFVTRSGRVRVGDLGICREMDSQGLATDMIGSLLYLAPEVARKYPYSCKVDIWSLGITSIELAQGVAPRHRLNADELLRELVYGNEVPFFNNPSQYSETFCDFVRSCLVIDPSLRPSAAELLRHPFLALAKGVRLESVAEEILSKVASRGSFASALQNSMIAKSACSSSFDMLPTSGTIGSSSSTSESSELDSTLDDSSSVASSIASSLLSSVPATPRHIITPRTPRRPDGIFARPKLQLPGKKGDIFTLGVPQDLASPRDFMNQVAQLDV